MSRGKFIPGGSRKDREAPAPAKGSAKGASTEAAPDSAAAGTDAATPAPAETKGKGGRVSRGAAGRSSSSKADPLRNVKIICAVGTLALLGVYFGFIRPMQVEKDRLEAANLLMETERKAEKDKAEKDRLAKEAAEKELARISGTKTAGPITVETTPADALVTIGTVTQPGGGVFKDLPIGELKLKVEMPKFTTHEETINLPPTLARTITVKLVPLPGKLEITSATKDVEYVLTAGENYKKEGKVPAIVSDVPSGDSSIVFRHKGWDLPPKKLSIEPEQAAKVEASFPYATARLTISPDGATVRDKNARILGKAAGGTLVLSDLRPGTYEYVVEKFGFAPQKLSISATEGQALEQTVTLDKNQDFETPWGLQLVWVPELQGWAGRYEVTQKQFSDIMGSNVSTHKVEAAKQAVYPVESVTYAQALDFCKEAMKKGGLRDGYRLTLPSDAQFNKLLGGADINAAVMQRNLRDATASLSKPAEVGSIAPNNLGLYDVLGNVAEWTTDPNPKNPDENIIRGGHYLSGENFTSADVRSYWPRVKGRRPPGDEPDTRLPYDGKNFLGFRVILVK